MIFSDEDFSSRWVLDAPTDSPSDPLLGGVVMDLDRPSRRMWFILLRAGLMFPRRRQVIGWMGLCFPFENGTSGSLLSRTGVAS